MESQQKAFESIYDKLCTAPVLACPNFDLPFILTTDAPKIEFAAVLSEVQNGVERPISYASRQMNRAEQSYSACEIEMLALMWATKYFRCYPMARRSDHAALSYARNFADCSSRVMRLSLCYLNFTLLLDLSWH